MQPSNALLFSCKALMPFDRLTSAFNVRDAVALDIRMVHTCNLAAQSVTHLHSCHAGLSVGQLAQTNFIALLGSFDLQAAAVHRVPG